MWYFVRGFFSLSITCLRLTYVVACNIIPFSCLIIFYCMTIAHSIYSLTDGHLDCIYILAIRNNAVMNIVYLFLCGCMFSYFLGVEFFSNSMFNLLGNCQNSYTVLQSYQKCMRNLLFPYACQQDMFIFYWLSF